METNSPNTITVKRVAWLGVLALIIATPLIILGRGSGEEGQMANHHPTSKTETSNTSPAGESLNSSGMNHQDMMKAISRCPVMSSQMETSHKKAESTGGCGSCSNQKSADRTDINASVPPTDVQSNSSVMPDHCKDKMASEDAASEHCKKHLGSMAAEVKECPMHDQSDVQGDPNTMMRNCPMHTKIDTVDATPQAQAEDHKGHHD